MNKNRVIPKKNINSNSVWFLILGISFITLYFNTKAYDPFNTPKLIFLLLTAGWLLGHIIDDLRKGLIKLKSQNVLIVMLPVIFVGSQVFSLLHSENLILGLIGDTQRRNGLLSYLALSIIFIFTSLRINYDFAIRIVKFAIILALILCTYGMMQVNGKDLIRWNNPYNSMILTLGNPNFASSLLAILVLISFFSIFSTKIEKFYKLTAILVSATGIYLIYKSQSRQGLLVIFFSILFYICILSFSILKKKSLPIIVIAVTLIGFAISGMLNSGPLSKFLYKESVSIRGFYWRAAIKMFETHPFTGIGLDNYGGYFKEFRDPSYPIRYGFDITSTNAHNVYLQLFSTGGFFVGVSYLAILFLVFKIGLQNLSNDSKDYQKLGILFLSVWIGFQSQSLISIDNLGISIWGWLLGGCIIGLNRSDFQSNKIAKFGGNFSKKYVHIKLFQPTISILVLFPLLIISLYLHRMETETFLARGFADPNNSQSKVQVNFYAKKVFNNPVADPFYKLLSALYLVDVGDVENGYKQIKYLYESDPRNLNYLRWLADYEKNNKNIKNEIHYRIQIAKFDPWNAENYYYLGLLYKEIGDINGALEMKSKIISFAYGTEIGNKAIRDLLLYE